MVKAFDCEVERIDDFVVEFDESIIDEKWMEDYRQAFKQIHTLEGHAENISQMRARFGAGFMEGYGFVLEDGRPPIGADEELVNKGINIRVVSEDEDCEVRVD